MVGVHPQALAASKQDYLVNCIQACFDCAQACTACADACLSDRQVAELQKMIRLDNDCADICSATGAILSRQTEPNWEIVRIQVTSARVAARECGEQCGEHARLMEHCSICMQACRDCESACAELLSIIE
jgi:hypothetical protein